MIGTATQAKVVLLQPPFFRVCGSHNDRAPLELCYASCFLEDAGISHVVVNADYSGSRTHLPWRKLFENEAYLRAAVDGQHAVLDECTEMVMQFAPEQVVIAAGDSCIPTKDFGSPYIAARVSERLRAYGVRTIGIGPIFLKDPAPFGPFFDGFFGSLVNRSLVDVLLGETPDVVEGSPIGELPLFSQVVPPGHATDYVMSNFGCSFDCSFCLAPGVTNSRVLFQPTGVFLRDLFERSKVLESQKLYVADMIFPLNVRRMRLLADALDGAGFVLSCESRTDTARPELLEPMRRMGVQTVKVGLEAMDDEALTSMQKRQTVEKEERALTVLKEYGFRVVGYLILGDFYPSVAAMERTLARAHALTADGLVQDWVVNVAAYETMAWDERKMDAHFSLASARRQGVPEEIVWKFLDLQEHRQHPTLTVLPS